MAFVCSFRSAKVEKPNRAKAANLSFFQGRRFFRSPYLAPMKIRLSLFLTFFAGALAAQSNALGTWNIFNFRYKLNNRWTLFSEGQVRSLGFYQDFHYHELTGGVIFRPNKQLALTLAVGDYDTYREGGDFVRPKNNDELRIWPQLTFTQELGRVRLEHRYRSEQRFTLQGFRLRFRSRVGIWVPLNTRSPRDGTIFLNVSNELFFTTREAYFERNRFVAVLGRRFSERCTAHVGYVHQFDYRINDETGRDFLQLALQIEISRILRPSGTPRF
jgi:hypothetical protein